MQNRVLLAGNPRLSFIARRASPRRSFISHFESCFSLPARPCVYPLLPQDAILRAAMAEERLTQLEEESTSLRKEGMALRQTNAELSRDVEAAKKAANLAYSRCRKLEQALADARRGAEEAEEGARKAEERVEEEIRKVLELERQVEERDEQVLRREEQLEEQKAEIVRLQIETGEGGWRLKGLVPVNEVSEKRTHNFSHVILDQDDGMYFQIYVVDCGWRLKFVVPIKHFSDEVVDMY